MRIALIGATGFVGSAVLKEALDRGHKVTAIVRHLEKITIQNNNLSLKKLDVLDIVKLTEAIKGSDVVISAYNPGWSNPDIYSEFLEGAESIQKAAKKSGVKRLIVVGGAGGLFIEPNLQLVDSPDFPEAIKCGAAAARDYLNLIKKETELEWTYLSPALEMHQGTSGIRKGSYRKGLENPVYDENNRSVISVEDAAVALIDEAENPQHIRQRFTIAY